MISLRWFAMLVLVGCSESAVSEPMTAEPSEPEHVYANWPDPLADKLRGEAQNAAVCARSGSDAVRDVFCGASATPIHSLAELQVALGVDTDSLTGRSRVDEGILVDIAVTGHSTGLSARSVSAINPRLIAFRTQLGQPDLVVLAFARGEQFVELIARDRADGHLTFYVAGFRQACNERDCTPGDLLTPAIERDWTELSLYDASDLTNTVLDCAPCHQAHGRDKPPRLLMQELNTPWTHWFWKQSKGGKALLDDYFAAKGDETLAGMSAERIEAADPNMITTLVIAQAPDLPVSFDSQRIEGEVMASAAAEGGEQPVDNSIPGQSMTWLAAYERAKRGEQIALPYYNVKVSDAEKLERATAAYRAFSRGELQADELPDLRDIFPDDPVRLAELGAMTEPGLDGREVLMQACAQCHNPRLDPELSRARFRADLDGMSREEKDLAIARLQLPPDNPLAMPPARLRVLSEEARERAIRVLSEP